MTIYAIMTIEEQAKSGSKWQTVKTEKKEISREFYNNTVDPRAIRFFRRLIRDFLFRSATPERTLELWEGVVKNEDRNIIPNKKYADYIIDSFMSYELGVIKSHLLNTFIQFPTNPSHSSPNKRNLILLLYEFGFLLVVF